LVEWRYRLRGRVEKQDNGGRFMGVEIDSLLPFLPTPCIRGAMSNKKNIQKMQERITFLERQNQLLAERLHVAMRSPDAARTDVLKTANSAIQREMVARNAMQRIANVLHIGLTEATSALREHDPRKADEITSRVKEGLSPIQSSTEKMPGPPLLGGNLELFFGDVGTDAPTSADSPSEPSTQPGSAGEASASSSAADGTVIDVVAEPAPNGEASQEFGQSATPAQLEKLKQSRNTGGTRKNRDLRTVTWLVGLDEADSKCPECGEAMRAVPSLSNTSEMLGMTPMEIITVSVVVKVYRCTCCGYLESATPPPRATPKGLCTLELGATLAVEKYDFHMPLHRTERRLDRLNSQLSAQNQFDMLAGMAGVLQKTRDAILEEILKAPWIHVDQTTWTNLQPGGKREYQLWIICTPTLTWYGIEESKGRVVFDRLLSGYTGVIVSDAAKTHLSAERDSGETWSLALCWAHLLRKFRDLSDAHPLAAKGHELIQAVFRADEKREPGEPRNELKKEVDTFFASVKDQTAVPGTALLAAFKYAIDHETWFRTMLDHPAVPMTNNTAERGLRPTVVGRNNHGGSRSKNGVMVAETFYTLCESAKLGGVDPVDYIHVAVLRARDNKENATLPKDVAAYPHLTRAPFMLLNNVQMTAAK
jgi:transposase